jgi:hypothetical protein
MRGYESQVASRIIAVTFRIWESRIPQLERTRTINSTIHRHVSSEGGSAAGLLCLLHLAWDQTSSAWRGCFRVPHHGQKPIIEDRDWTRIASSDLNCHLTVV